MPRSFCFAQVPVLLDPVLNLIDQSKLGSQIVLDNILSMRITRILESGSDSADIVFSNQNGDASPLLPTSSLGRYFFSGPVDNKIQIYSGIVDGSGVETAIPEGVFVNQSFNQASQGGENKATINALDNFIMFQGDVYTQFPPRLYGNQTSSYFNPNYQLQNPSGDLQTYVCDAVNWMNDPTTAPAWASDYAPLAVYVGTSTAPANVVTTNTYTVNNVTGTITFASPLASGSIVSVDCRPLAMAPELMLKHLICDFANFSPNFLKFDNTGIYLPIMQVVGGTSILETAKSIAACCAPRGVQWQLFFDELGYLNFRELAIDGPSVVTLIDEKDILSAPVEYQSQNITNVVTASATAINSQPIEVVAYSIDSINIFSQYPDYQVNSVLLNTVGGMDPGSAVMYMSGLANTQVFQGGTPTIFIEIEILYNPLLQVGDCVSVREMKTGVNQDFYIQQITKEFDGENVKQTLRLQQQKQAQSNTAGNSFYAGAPIPNTPNTGIGQTSLLASVSLVDTTHGTQTVLSNGMPVLNGLLNPVVAQWDGGPLTINIDTVAPGVFGGTQSNLWIYRAMYILEDVYNVTSDPPVVCTGNGCSLNGGGIFVGNSPTPSSAAILDLTGEQNGFFGVSTEGYDFRANLDTAEGRRYFRPLLRPANWVLHDGITSYQTAQTFSDTWSGGPGVYKLDIHGDPSQTFLYGNLRAGISNAFNNTSPYFYGQALYATGTAGSEAIGASSTTQFGWDFGYPAVGFSMTYGIKRKNTPCILLISLMCDSGVIQTQRIPFTLAL